MVLDQALVNFFWKEPVGKYFRLRGHTVCPATAQPCGSCHSSHIYEQMWLCLNTFLFMDTKISISHNFHKIFSFQLYKNVKIISAYRPYKTGCEPNLANRSQFASPWSQANNVMEASILRRSWFFFLPRWVWFLIILNC